MSLSLTDLDEQSDSAAPLLAEARTSHQSTSIQSPDVSIDGEPIALEAPAKQKRNLGALQLMMMVYFIVVGGPFGIESAVGAAGPLMTMLGVVAIVLLWSFPQALMGAELALMMDVNGGPVVWVATALGPLFGFINAYAMALNGVVSLSMVVVLFVEYIPYTFPGWQGWLMRFVFCGFITAINILGVGWVSRLSVLFLLIVLSPFIAGAALDVVIREDIDISTLLMIPPRESIGWSVLISAAVWANDRVDSVGSLAGEVKGGTKTYLIGVIGAFPLILITYALPVAIFYLPYPHADVWDSEYFVTIAYKMNEWLGHWMLLAAIVSLFGAISSGLASLSLSFWAMATGEKDCPPFAPKLLAWSTRSADGTMRPVAAILLSGTLVFGFAALPFIFLVQVYLVVRLLNLFLEYATLIYLRIKQPSAPRPWRVPGGLAGVFLLPLPTVVFSAVSLYFSPMGVLLTGGIASAVICLAGVIFERARARYRRQADAPAEQVPDHVM